MLGKHTDSPHWKAKESATLIVIRYSLRGRDLQGGAERKWLRALSQRHGGAELLEALSSRHTH